MTTLTTCSIETWIDQLNAVWGVEYRRNDTVDTPKCVGRNDFPESLPGLGSRPVAISYPVDVDFEYGDPSSSWPTKAVWRGQSEIHLTPDLKKSNLPFILPFFRRLLHAAIASHTLGGLVDEFHLRQPSMELSQVKYGSENEHYAIVIYWQVSENLTGKL